MSQGPVHAAPTALDAEFKQQAVTMATEFYRVIKVALSESITSMFSMALSIVILGLIIICFIPVLTLRSGHVPTDKTQLEKA